MSTQVKFRRGTTAEHATFTGADGEMTVDTDKKVTVIHDGATAGGFPTPGSADIQKQSFTYIATPETGSTADAYLLSATPSISAYTAGMKFGFLPDANNTGSVTVNIDSVGAVTLKKLSGGSLVDLEADDLVSGVYYEITRIGSFFQVSGGGLSGDSSSSPISSSAVSGSPTTINFTDIFTAGNSYEILIDNLEVSGNTYLYGRIAASGTSWLTSLYDSVAKGRGSGATDANLNQTSQSVIYLTPGQIGPNYAVSGKILLNNPADNSDEFRISFYFTYRDNTDGLISYIGGAKHRTIGQDAGSFQFLLQGATTFSSGNIAIYERSLS